MTAALVAEAARRSRVCWLSYDTDGEDSEGSEGGAGSGTAVRSRLVWHAWYDDALVVLSCPAADGFSHEQVLPRIDRSRTVQVTMRSKDTGGRLLTWTGRVEVVRPGTEAWAGHVDALLGVRLNLRDPGAARHAWAERGTVVRIRPTPAPADEAGDGGVGALP